VDRPARHAGTSRWRGSLTGIGLVVAMSAALSLVCLALAALIALAYD